MADRFFPNVMPDFVAENPQIIEEKQDEIIPHGTQDSLLKLLALPHSILFEQLKRTALDLKETIVVETWGLSGQRVEDFTLYCGSLGTAFLVFKSFQVTHNKNDLNLCSEIVKACDEASLHSRYLIKNRFPGGNYPASEEDRKRDVLVHWCHGAPGIALTLVKAAEVFGDKEFLEAAMNAAEVVWNRGLLKRVGICHGISGNAYVFLSLYRLTGIVEYLYRAKAFACFLLDRAHMLMSSGEMHGGDAPFSLFEGVGGMAYFFLDMIQPRNARFPAYEL